eukprot:877920-Prorocentrum_lima.AAC.1
MSGRTDDPPPNVRCILMQTSGRSFATPPTPPPSTSSGYSQGDCTRRQQTVDAMQPVTEHR